MAIPGMQPKLEARAKVRVGVKNARNLPESVDYFVSDDEEFQRICGEKPKRILIEFPHSEAADNWSDGLEWWVKTKSGNSLACYTKDAGSDPTALRKEAFLSEDGWEEKRGALVGERRQPIKCLHRSCPQMVEGKCKPMGRLVFFLKDGRRDLPLQIDTKSWYSCEEITAGIDAAMRRKPNLVGRTFALSVSLKTKGTSKFPVLSLEEVNVEVNTASDVDRADALVTLGNNPTREGLAAYLDATHPGWRDKPAFTERIREVGVDEAIKSILERAA